MAIPVIKTAVTRTVLRGPILWKTPPEFKSSRPEPVGGQHEEDAEDGQERVEHRGRKQWPLDGRLERFVARVVEQRPRRFAEESGELSGNPHVSRNGSVRRANMPLKNARNRPRNG